jgi:uncharacterized protein (TIGR02594 family)
MNEPAWVIEARRHIGVKEIPGPRHHPKILEWWRAIRRGGIKRDEVPWCAAYVGGCLEAVGIISSRFESARSYMTWGVPIPQPVLGCVAVFSRKGGGHVGFVTGMVDDGRLLILGGNQNDQVSITPFDRGRLVGYRWPQAVPITDRSLPVLASKQRSSTNEA